MDNFLLQSLIDSSGAEMAFSNGWRFGAPVPVGPVVMNDIYNIIPMNPPISTVTLSGREIWQMMEENLERTFSRDPLQQMGGSVKRCLGLNAYIKIENPAGTRIQELFVRGRRVRPDRDYHAAFVTVQGVPERFGRDRRDLDIRAVDAMQHLLSRGPVMTSGDSIVAV